MAGEKLVGAALRKLNSLGLFSKGAEEAAALKQAKGTPEQMRAMLLKQGVKPAELDNAGFSAAFAGRPSVTKDEIAKLLEARAPKIEEKVLGGNPKGIENPYRVVESSGEYKIEIGGQNLYPQNISSRAEAERLAAVLAEDDPSVTPLTKYQQYTLPGGENYREVLLRASDDYLDEAAKRAGSTAPNANDYTSSHWDDPNVLAHLRMADRTGPGGEKMLHIEEIQSDWGQAGRNEGFADPVAYAKWVEQDNATRTALLAAKRAHDQLVSSRFPQENARFRPGQESPREFEDRLIAAEEQRQRLMAGEPAFNESIARVRAASDARSAIGTPPSREGVPSAPYVTSTPAWTDLALKRALREAAEGDYHAMAWTPGAEQAKRYPGGGEAREAGMTGYYDKIVPTQLQKLVKPLDPNAQFGTTSIGEVQAPSLTITPEMRESIKKGLPLFAVPGAVGLGAAQQEEPREGFQAGGPAESDYSLVDDVLARIRDGRISPEPNVPENVNSIRPSSRYAEPNTPGAFGVLGPFSERTQFEFQPTRDLDFNRQPQAPNFDIPPEAYTEAGNAKFTNRAEPLNLQPPASAPAPAPAPLVPPAPPVVQQGLDAVRAEPRPLDIVNRRRAPAPMPAPRPRAPVPAPRPRAPMPANPNASEVRRLWAIYNETGNPADFARASNAMRMGRADGGFVDYPMEYARGGRTRLLQDKYPTSYMPHVGRQVMADGGAPDSDIAMYERQMAERESMPEDIRYMTHTPTAPTRPVEIEGGFLSGKRKLMDSPYNVAGLRSNALQFAYDLKTLPFYFTPAAPLAMASDIGEGMAAGSPLQVAMSAMGPLGRAGRRAVGAATGATAAVSPDEAQAGAIQKALNAIRAYHGSPHKFNAFDPDEVSWFSTSEQTAKNFGRNRMGSLSPAQGGSVSKWDASKPEMYEVSIPPDRLQIVEPMREAQRLADEIGVDAPKTWDEAAELLQWASAQKQWIDEARDAGKGGVLFKDVADDPLGIESDHIAVIDPTLIEILRKYGIAGLLGGGSVSQGMLPRWTAAEQPPVGSDVDAYIRGIEGKAEGGSVVERALSVVSKSKPGRR